MKQIINMPSTDNYRQWEEWGQAMIRTLQSRLATGATEVGQVASFVGNFVGGGIVHPPLPDGWLLCNGSSFSALGYPELFLVLGGNTLPLLSSPYGSGFVVGIKAA